MNDQPPKEPRRHLGYKILMVSLCLVLLGFFVVLFLNVSDKDALNRYEREWEAKGERFDFASYIPQPVPDDQNFALTPIVASCYEGMLDKNGRRIVPPNTNVVDRLRMSIYGDQSLVDYPTNSGNWAKGTRIDLKEWQLFYRALAAKTNEFPIPPQVRSPAADVLLALGKYDAAIAELRQAAARPLSRFPLKYDNDLPATIALPHLATLKSCSQILQFRAVAELQKGQSDLAAADVKLLLRVIDSVRTESFLISQLVRIALLNFALQPVWEGLQDHQWSDVQLTELSEELAKLDFLADYEFSMRGEKVRTMTDIEYLRRTRHLGVFFNEEDSTPGIIQAAYHLIPNSVFYQNELAIARAHQEWFPPIVEVGQHLVSPVATRLAQTSIEKMRSHWSPNIAIAYMLLPAIPICAEKYAYAQSAVDMARVACALERFRLAQGNYPETLDALAPRYIESLPRDVIGGQPLKYRRTSNGQFALYSVGWNGTDDGGAVVLKEYSNTSIDLNQGDWVWTGQVMSGQ